MKLSNILKPLTFLSLLAVESKVEAYNRQELCNTLFDETCPLSRPCMNAQTMDVITGMTFDYGDNPLPMIDYITHTCDDELEARATEIANMFMDDLEKRMEDQNIRFSFEDDFRQNLVNASRSLWLQTTYNAFGLVAKLNSPFVPVQETMEYADGINVVKLVTFNAKKRKLDKAFATACVARLNDAFESGELEEHGLQIKDLTKEYDVELNKYVEDIRFDIPENKTLTFSVSARSMHQNTGVLESSVQVFDYTTKPKNRTRNVM